MPYLKKAQSPSIRKVNREQRNKVYHSQKWQELRKAKLMQQPLCEVCLQQGKVTPAIDVHHIDSFTNYDGTKRLEKAYSFGNLLSVCKQCHQKLHNGGIAGWGTTSTK